MSDRTLKSVTNSSSPSWAPSGLSSGVPSLWLVFFQLSVSCFASNVPSLWLVFLQLSVSCFTSIVPSCGWSFHRYVLFMHFKNLNDVHSILTWLLAKCWCGVKGLRLSVSPLPGPHGTRTILEVLNLSTSIQMSFISVL